MARRNKGNFINCPRCGLSIKESNLDSHIVKVHSSEPERAVEPPEEDHDIILFEVSIPIATEKELKFKCLHCPKSCCMNRAMQLTWDEVEKISEKFNRNTNSFAEMRKVKGEDWLLMKTKLVALKNENKIVPACIFLKIERDGKNTCTIHDIYKPAVCRIYPYSSRKYTKKDQEKLVQNVNVLGNTCLTYDPRCPGVGADDGTDVGGIDMIRLSKDTEEKIKDVNEKLRNHAVLSIPRDKAFTEELKNTVGTNEIYPFGNYSFFSTAKSFTLELQDILHALSFLDKRENVFYLSENHVERGIFFIVEEPNLDWNGMLEAFLKCNPMDPTGRFRTIIYSGFQDSGTSETGIFSCVSDYLKEPYKSAYKPIKSEEAMEEVLNTGKAEVVSVKRTQGRATLL